LSWPEAELSPNRIQLRVRVVRSLEWMVAFAAASLLGCGECRPSVAARFHLC
jgi:hypothetical protein